MKDVVKFRTEIEEIRDLLNTVAASMGKKGCNYEILMDISIRMDKLILEYAKNMG